MGIVIPPKVLSFKVIATMERAFQNILDEIIEHVVEGLCFDAHRAVKLGYFPLEEYSLMDQKFVHNVGKKDDKNEIHFDGVYTECADCGGRFSAHVLMRHKMGRRCKSNKQNNPTKTENDQNHVDTNDKDSRKKPDSIKQTKSAKNYKKMSPEEIMDFLQKNCGVISGRTGKPCLNSINCSKHSPEERNRIRICHGFESFADDNIDIDTV